MGFFYVAATEQCHLAKVTGIWTIIIMYNYSMDFELWQCFLILQSYLDSTIHFRGIVPFFC